MESPQSSVVFGEKIDKFKNSDKITFFSHIEKGMPAPTLTRPEVREFVVDSGTSMHTMSKNEFGNFQEVRF